MNNKDILKKMKNLPNNPASKDSPIFSGIPTAPTATLYDSSEQIANVEFINNKMRAKVINVDDKLEVLEEKVNKLDDMDMEKLENDIKQDVSSSISADVLTKLSNEVVKISFSDIFLKQKSTISTVDTICDIIDGMDERVIASLNNSKNELYSRKAKCVELYDDMSSKYNSCINGEIQYSVFESSFITWYEYITQLDLYCLDVIQMVNYNMIQFKADATQEEIFDILTNGGEVKALKLEQDANGVKQIYVNSQYVNLKGTMVKNDDNKIKLGINSDGSIIMDISELYVNGKYIDNVIEEAITSSEVMTSAIDNATSELKTKVNTISSKIERIENTMDNISNIIKDSIIDDIVYASEMSSLETIFTDLKSRYESVIVEINTVLALVDINDNNKITLNNYKNNVISYFDDLLTAFNNAINRPSDNTIVEFNQCVNDYNKYVGVTRSYCKTIQNNIIKELSDSKLNATKLDIVNTLTGNGIDRTITLDEDNMIVIDGEHVKSQDFKSDNSITTKTLNVQKIKSNNIASKLNSDYTVSVSTEGTDIIELVDNSSYKTLQNIINIIPDILTKEVTISLDTSIIENINIKSKIGGKINIYMNKNNIIGNINIENCNSEINIYGGVDKSDLPPGMTPIVSPYNLLEVGSRYCSIHISNSHNVKLHNVSVYGQHYNFSQSNPTKVNSLYSIIVDKGSKAIVENCVVCDSYNGICCDETSQVTAINNVGYVEQYGVAVYKGGRITVIGKYIAHSEDEWSNNSNEYGEGIIIDCTTPFDDVAHNYTDNNNIMKLTQGVNKDLIMNETIINSYITNNTVKLSRIGKITKYSNDTTCFLFGNMFDKYLNKKIQSIKIVLTRTFDGDYDKDALLSIKYHSYRYLDELQELSSNGQLPSLSTWAKAITFEGWKESENVNTRVFMINDVDLLNDIERGIVKGFNLNLMPLSECDYAVFNNMEVIIEYKNN